MASRQWFFPGKSVGKPPSIVATKTTVICLLSATGTFLGSLAMVQDDTDTYLRPVDN